MSSAGGAAAAAAPPAQELRVELGLRGQVRRAPRDLSLSSWRSVEAWLNKMWDDTPLRHRSARYTALSPPPGAAGAAGAASVNTEADWRAVCRDGAAAGALRLLLVAERDAPAGATPAADRPPAPDAPAPAAGDAAAGSGSGATSPPPPPPGGKGEKDGAAAGKVGAKPRQTDGSRTPPPGGAPAGTAAFPVGVFASAEREKDGAPPPRAELQRGDPQFPWHLSLREIAYDEYRRCYAQTNRKRRAEVEEVDAVLAEGARVTGVHVMHQQPGGWRGGGPQQMPQRPRTAR